uniref:glycoside hydrolase domain-containing protein n=2 Tax=Actinomyces israelii TaxID=1659 RepID=UPI000AD701B2|nr:glycoside hydrolase domain-containing protein [Actinomyces israelii]
MWCKGYSTGSSITTHFYAGTGNAIRDLKADMGIGGDSTVTVDIMRALLSMDQFVLLARYGGIQSIRDTQQKLNREYRAYVGIIPTDGLYGREMNTALIKTLQAIEGYSPDKATGNFGTGTRSKLVEIDAANAPTYPKWVWLASVLLVCNGYPVQITQDWHGATDAGLDQFQKDYALPRNGKIDPTTWMSLMTSKGDPDRPCDACDTRFEVTSELLAHLKTSKYQIVGRYLTEPDQASKQPGDYFKAIRPGELERITGGGLKYFPIFQENSRQLSDFTFENGARHAREAQAAAHRLRIPPTVIYFAVDMDVYEYQIDQVIEPYFRAIKENLGGGYGVGVYASRNTCSKIAKHGHTISSFVSDMSSGFSGNLGYPIPANWNYDQFAEISNYAGKWDLDRVAHAGRVAACSSVLSSSSATPYPDPDPAKPEEDPLLAWSKKTERECLESLGKASHPIRACRGSIGEFILEWLRKPEYWGDKYGGLWRLYTPEIPSPSELESARQICNGVCKKQPAIKGLIPNRDIAHMAATAVGCLEWGIEEDNKEYGLGDLGGWPLDLLQIWGAYEREDDSSDLAAWLEKHLGSMHEGKGFGYKDVLADADAWLIARNMIHNPSSNALTNAMRDVFKQSETHRIGRFYRERFGSRADNVVTAFKKVADGIDALGLKKILAAP